ncbi:hypothetical protein V8G54_037261 [Vigna mungo]|uniref:Uncharacterized protein n=1 Tax=Vigna mungo TaxID=3915 RepID=A0AAQ3MIH6_VIGMU
MSSSNRGPDKNKGKQIVVSRNPNPSSGWINDDDSRNKFLMNPDLVEVLYQNLKFVNDGTRTRVKGVDIEIDDFIWILFTRLEAKGELSHLSNSEFNVHLKKSDMYSSWRRSPEVVSIKGQYRHEGLKKE